ncbi:hypothetical protein RSA13_03895 [Pantoea stewartii]|uniref:Uncharacterized protein n=1 Tax=Pantoea stewartii TaxID=66269 RepID=A0AB34VKI3_9GAMM|nr:hypothetical protein RSA13_03895 [Pantoea stewartii]
MLALSCLQADQHGRSTKRVISELQDQSICILNAKSKTISILIKYYIYGIEIYGFIFTFL